MNSPCVLSTLYGVIMKAIVYALRSRYQYLEYSDLALQWWIDRDCSN
jgi:hypothetical protein